MIKSQENIWEKHNTPQIAIWGGLQVYCIFNQSLPDVWNSLANRYFSKTKLNPMKASKRACRTDEAFFLNGKLLAALVFLLADHLFFAFFQFGFQFDKQSKLFRWSWRWKTTPMQKSKNDITSQVQKATRYDSTQLAGKNLSKS